MLQHPLCAENCEATHVALTLGHIDSVLNVWWNDHVIVFRLALLLLKLLFVQFL